MALKSEKSFKEYLKKLSDDTVIKYYSDVEYSPFPVLIIQEYTRRFEQKSKNEILKDLKKQLGLTGFLFHGDDYFKLPPKDNHNARIKNISQVGIEEVDLATIDENILKFKNNNIKIIKPLVNYSENRIGQEILNASEYDFCIVEGAYASILKNPDFKIFMNLTYIDTKKNRFKRARDIMNAFNEQVLNIEHLIIKEHLKLSNMIIDSKLNIKIQ